jgi:hypothetical protein
MEPLAAARPDDHNEGDAEQFSDPIHTTRDKETTMYRQMNEAPVYAGLLRCWATGVLQAAPTVFEAAGHLCR